MTKGLWPNEGHLETKESEMVIPVGERLRLAIRCDEIDHFAAILRLLEALHNIAGISLKAIINGN